MNASSQVVVPRRTVDDIALELTLHRNFIREQLESNDIADNDNASGDVSFGEQLIRTAVSLQRYISVYMSQGSAQVSPVEALDFVKKRPLLIGIAATAVVGIVVAAGPRRIVGWAVKISAMWRVISALRK